MTIVLYFCFALIPTVLVLPGLLYLAARFELYDSPGPLKVHNQAKPRLGGVAMLVGMLASASAAVWSGHPFSWTFLLALLDLYGLSPLVRLTAQVCAALLIWSAGSQVHVMVSPIRSALVAILFTVLFVNAFNMLDGSDGLAAGVAAIIASGYILVNVQANNSRDAAIACSLLGVTLGFLLFNFPPAKIFMGDSGSTMLGLIIAFLGLSLCRDQTYLCPRLLIPLLFAALPLVDAMAAIVRRVRRKTSPFKGDREHAYDLFLQRGWSAGRVAFSCYLITTVLVALGVAASSILWFWRSM
jgi:UDP-GlcNAc:undecaprenyl-phosphate GlcNAc-1-phosphate transferase